MFKMMKKLTDAAKVTALSATVFAALMSSGASAWDGLNRTISLVNDSQYSTVMHLYITDKGRTDWGNDLLGSDVLYPGYFDYFTPVDRGYCKFDLLVVFDTGHQDVLEDVNLCEVYEIDVNDYGFSWIYA